MTNSLLLGNFEQNLFSLLFSSINLTSQGARLSFEKNDNAHCQNNFKSNIWGGCNLTELASKF